MIKTGRVSVWIGNMKSEDELLSFVDEGSFGRDFDLEVNPAVGRELVVKPQPVPLAELVEGFSYWKVFGPECIRRGMDLGFSTANSMVVLYTCEYVPSNKVNTDSSLKFVGVFDF